MAPAMLKEELGLSEQQASELEKLRLDARRSGIRRHADTQLARLNLQEALSAPNVDERLVQSRTKELADLAAANIRARVDARLAMRKILTAEQQHKLDEMRPRLREGLDRPQDGSSPDRGPRPPRPRPRRGEDGRDGRGEDRARDTLTRPDGR
jgi:Spy/CpxP family protein refolding chaperone